MAYVYVDNRDVAKILKNGFWSTRASFEADPAAIEKYLISNYLMKYECIMHDPEYGPELRRFNEIYHYNTQMEKILGYLDFRDETKKGSRAIYFLFAPIPEALHSKFNRRRYNFLKGKTLLKLNVDHERMYVVADRFSKDAFWYTRQHEMFWHQIVDDALNFQSENPKWDEGIPHGYIVPDNGKVVASLCKSRTCNIC